jgi:nitrous oxidase accessory protein NosD
MRTAIATVLLLGILNGSAAAYDRFVNPRGTCGPGTVGARPQHATIQEAVDAAAPGDAIGVCPDEYLDGVTVPASKTGLSLTGLGIVLLRAISAPSFSGFEIEADDVTVERFEIRGFDTAGVSVIGHRARIRNNHIHRNAAGVILQGDGHRVQANAIEGNVQFGILAALVNGLEIAGNRILGGGIGIAAFAVDQTSPGTAIHHNLVRGAFVGIGVGEAAGGTIRNNTVRFSEERGIVAIDTTALLIVQNLVHRNGGSGIEVLDSTDCGVGFNSVGFNGLVAGGHGIALERVDGCVVARNNVSRNGAPDCAGDGAGANTFVANACASEDPPGDWD